MSRNNKVIWSEGLFLRPQHFQQHDRYIESYADARSAHLSPYPWGFTELAIDRPLLSSGRIAVVTCRGLLPDGTPFSAPDEADVPPPLSIPEDSHNERVFLALPLKRAGMPETDAHTKEDTLARYMPLEQEVADNNVGQATTAAALQLGQLRLRLMLEREDRSGFSCLELTRTKELTPERGVDLDPEFIPTSLVCAASAKLAGYISELQGLFHSRGEEFARRVTESGRGGVSEVADFMLLQTINRLEPLFGHMASLPGLHPEIFFRFALQSAGELATFFSDEKRPKSLPTYQHSDLQSTFAPLIDELRKLLRVVVEQRAVAIAIEERKYGVRVAAVADRTLLKDALFVLAVRAAVRPEIIQTQFPAQIKVGPVEYIRQLVNSGLPGIGLRVLPVTPRQIPFHAGCTYFELDRTSQYWQGLEQSSAVAIHVAGDFPGLELELWAIKG